MLIHVKEKHLKILEALAIYKFLTVSHFERLGIIKGRANINRALGEIKKGRKALIGDISFGILREIGKIPFVYYLTKNGVEFVIDNLNLELDKIKFPIGTYEFFSRDYFHRIACIDFQIEFRRWTIQRELDIFFYDNYYDKTGSNRKKGSKSIDKTRIDLKNEDYYIPDSAFQFGNEKKKLLYLFEHSNGKNTKKIFKQIYQHAVAIAEKAPVKKYKVEKDCRVVMVFEHESIKSAVMSRMKSDKDLIQFKKYFLLKTHEEVETDFFNGWCFFDGIKVDFFGREERTS